MTELEQYRIRARSAAELIDGLEAAVTAGDLRAGSRLPSVRRLAGGLQLSPATVAAALSELRRRGVIVTEPRRGSRIADGPPLWSRPAPAPVPDGARDLSNGNPDPELLPDLANALARCEMPRRLYGQAPELPELIEAAREQLRDDGLPDGEMCVVSGAMDGIERVLVAALRAGDAVAVESPGYADLFDLLRARGMKLEPVSLDERGMRPEALAAALARGVRAVVLTPRGQNPTGAALDAERAERLRDVLAGHPEVLVVEDDHLGPVAGAPARTLLTGRTRWAAARSVAKALGPDLRLAVLSGDEATIAHVRGAQQCGPGWVSHILQALVAELWRDETAMATVARAGATYASRREGLLASLAVRGVGARGASGLNVWIEAPDEALALAALLARGWVVAPGSRYRLGGGPQAIRVTTAALKESETEALADDIAAALGARTAARSG